MWRPLAGLAALCALIWGCGSIPTAPEELAGSDSGDLTYYDESWGFQISRPTPDWGLSVQTFALQRYDNGKPAVDVRISSPYLEYLNASFRPQMRLEPRALQEGVSLDDLATGFEEFELKPLFDGYGAVGDKVRVSLEGGEAIEWRFRNSGFNATQNRIYPGTDFLAAVAIHNAEGYFMIGNGSGDGFPVAEYEKIVASLRFVSGK